MTDSPHEPFERSVSRGILCPTTDGPLPPAMRQSLLGECPLCGAIGLMTELVDHDCERFIERKRRAMNPIASQQHPGAPGVDYGEQEHR